MKMLIPAVQVQAGSKHKLHPRGEFYEANVTSARAAIALAERLKVQVFELDGDFWAKAKQDRGWVCVPEGGARYSGRITP